MSTSLQVCVRIDAAKRFIKQGMWPGLPDVGPKRFPTAECVSYPCYAGDCLPAAILGCLHRAAELGVPLTRYQQDIVHEMDDARLAGGAQDYVARWRRRIAVLGKQAIEDCRSGTLDRNARVTIKTRGQTLLSFMPPQSDEASLDDVRSSPWCGPANASCKLLMMRRFVPC